MKTKTTISLSKTIIVLLIIIVVIIATIIGVYFGLANRCNITFQTKYDIFGGIDIYVEYHGSSNIINKTITAHIVGRDNNGKIDKTIEIDRYDNDISLNRIRIYTGCTWLQSIKIYADGIIIGRWTGNLNVADLVV